MSIFSGSRRRPTKLPLPTMRQVGTLDAWRGARRPRFAEPTSLRRERGLVDLDFDLAGRSVCA